MLETPKKISPYWARDYRYFEPNDTPEGHWGRGQTGFNLALSGRVLLADGRKVKRDGLWVYPCHRDIVVGEGRDQTAYSGIYSYGFRGGPVLWLYPFAEAALNDVMCCGLASLVGVHKIDGDTPVRSNDTRRILFRLGEIDCCLPQAA